MTTNPVINRTHSVHLVDEASGGTIHAEVIFLDRGPDRGRWRTRCAVCTYQATHDEIGQAVEDAFTHGLYRCTDEG